MANPYDWSPYAIDLVDDEEFEAFIEERKRRCERSAPALEPAEPFGRLASRIPQRPA